MIILGIETSCDETAACIVKDGREILSNTVASSLALHTKNKGVIPELAAREQLKYIISVIKKTLNNNSREKPEDLIDAIAVTIGPGLIGSLLVGVETAKTLSYLWNKPIVPVNHLIGHIYTNFVSQSQKNNINFKKVFPAIVLLVSGGHTQLLLMAGHGKFKPLGQTRDDAAGECFDKCARLLGLPYPGGPAIERASRSIQYKVSSMKYKLPRPMMDQNNFDFSFSGLKTSVLNQVQQYNNLTITKLVPRFAYEIQEAITDVLVFKSLKAADKYPVKSIILGGGVAANEVLREKFKKEINKNNLKINFFAPLKEYSTDNALGIASAAYFNFQPIYWSKIYADPGLEVI